MTFSDITSAGTLLFGFIGLCITLHKAFSDLKIELEKLRGEMREFVTHHQCHQNRSTCPCVLQMQTLQDRAIKAMGRDGDGQ